MVSRDLRLGLQLALVTRELDAIERACRTRRAEALEALPVRRLAAEANTALAASVYVPENGRVRMLIDPKLTHEREPAPAVVLVKRKGMKEAWCLVTSLKDARASDIVAAYSRRFTIAETFRDTKDLTFGMGLRATHIRDEERRDRMLLLIAIAQTLLTLLGVAAECSWYKAPHPSRTWTGRRVVRERWRPSFHRHQP